MGDLTIRARYFAACLRKNLAGESSSCPSCGSAQSTNVDQKWVVTALRRCAKCQLLFRTPTSGRQESAEYYQEDYRQGFTTSIPNDVELAALLASGFQDHEKNYGVYLGVLEALGTRRGQRLLDFGCSWGYGAYQLQAYGFLVSGYEISRQRAAYAAERLGISMVDPALADPGSFDIVFSAHVIEHVPSVADFLATGLRLLKPGGLFVAFTPNGSREYRQVSPAGWRHSWGRDHPQLIDSEFLRARFPGGVLAASAPYDLGAISSWHGREQIFLVLSGSELMFAVRKES